MGAPRKRMHAESVARFRLRGIILVNEISVYNVCGLGVQDVSQFRTVRCSVLHLVRMFRQTIQ